MSNEVSLLSTMRMQHARECLTAAETLLQAGSYKGAANRAYYAIFHAMRAVLAFDGIDMKHHSGIIAQFRRLYIKTCIFDKELSNILSEAFDVRSDSDYDDFFMLSQEDAEAQVHNAQHFLDCIEVFLSNRAENA